MTFNDRWLIEKARRKKAETAHGPRLKAAAVTSLPPIDGLWSSLQQEVVRQAKVYTDALGDPAALAVETPPDAIVIRASDGKAKTLRVDLKGRTLSETSRDGLGALRSGKPNISFVMNAAGEVTFNFGSVQTVATSVLRTVIR